MGGGTATLNQVHFRFRTDTNNPDTGTKTWAAAQDTNAGLPLDTPIVLRIVAQNTGSAVSGTLQCRYSRNGGAYTDFGTTTTVVRSADASGAGSTVTLTAANFQLTAGAGSAANGQYSIGTTTVDSFPAAPVPIGSYVEYESSFQLRSADGVVAGDTFDFRWFNVTTAFASYSVTPRITVASTYNDSVSETASAVDTPSAIATLLASTAETGIADDTPSNVATLIGSTAESGSASDTSSGALTMSATATETGTALETISGALIIAVSDTETGSAADTSTVSATLPGSVSESGSAADDQSVIATLLGATAETLTARDTSDGQVPGSPSDLHALDKIIGTGVLTAR